MVKVVTEPQNPREVEICIIGVSLSKPHISVTSLHSACVWLIACLDRALTGSFKSADFTCMCTKIVEHHEKSTQGTVKRSTCSMDDHINKDEDHS